MPASQHQIPKSDIAISQAAQKRPILDVAREKLGITPEHLEPYGHYKAKVSMEYVKSLKDKKNGKLVLVTAISPTPAGEGKTTTTVGLTDALNFIGKKAMCALREPSLGPSFGMKGGAAGGGYAQVIPMEDINLHFTGDFHAITSAHNLLSALIDNHIYWGNALGIDSRRVTWRRVMDMNDRALREIVCSLGGVANGYPREAGFDITVASEVMAIFCLAKDLDDLKARLKDAPLVFFDGTVWRDDELIAAGLGNKTGQGMGHIAMSGDQGAIASLAGLDIGRKVFLHINNSNPALLGTSAERKAAEQAGWQIPSDGTEIVL